MQRTIIPEEQIEEEIQQVDENEVVKQQGDENEVVKQQVANLNNGVLISSSELEQIFFEWDATGKNDLIINNSLASRIQDYLEYQEIMKPLKVKLAEEQFERYIVKDTSAKTGKEHWITINGKELSYKLLVYEINGSYSYMTFEIFRNILCVCKNPFAFYAYQDEEKIINVKGWILEHGGEYEEADNVNAINIQI